MGNFKIYGSPTNRESQREFQHKILAREAAKEGIVLLKNSGVLPLKTQNISLFGYGARKTVKGGSGSGEVHERKSISIEEGLRLGGFVFDTRHLDRTERTYQKAIDEYEANKQKVAATYSPLHTMKMFIALGNLPRPLPSESAILDDEIEDHEVAIYLIARQAGEGHDRALSKGDYYLSDIEVNNVRKLSLLYPKLVLILNTGSPIDLSILDEVRVDAVIHYSQAGMEGGHALCELLLGKANFSGKLTATWANTYEDYPSSMTYSHINHQLEDENYFEGIYVGYRYFTSFKVKPRFSFGYGLSYTKFNMRYLSASCIDDVIQIKVEVTNVGDVEGKEVVQVYLTKPGLDVEAKSLVAFCKTALLDKGEVQVVTLSFNVSALETFDEARACYVIRQGTYGISVGHEVENTTFVCVIAVKENIVSQACTASPMARPPFEDKVSQGNDIHYDATLPVIHVNAYARKSATLSKLFSAQAKAAFNKLDIKQKTMLVVGGGYKIKSFVSVMGAAGRTNTELMKYGIPNIIMSDGPAGLNVVPKNAFTKSGSIRYPEGLPEMWKYGWLKHVGFLLKGNKHKLMLAYRYATAFPAETCLAQSWNTDLLYEVGQAVGREMKEFGISVWLAPGMNIQRNPLCGRNFEYYSEDPLLSGKMASSITRGVQDIGGVGVAIKHYCCNNQEDNRMRVSANLSHRALREIYLKGFEIAVRESAPWTVMSSYNRVNKAYVCNSEYLLTDILRNEWGFDGVVMSDWDAVNQASFAQAIHAGNDLIMPGTKKIQKQLQESYKHKRLAKEKLDMSTMRILELIFKSHTSKEFKG